MACYILNGTEGRVSNSEILENLFSGQNTTGTNCTGKSNGDENAKLSENEGTRIIWHAKNKYYEANIDVYVSTELISNKYKVIPVGAIVYYADKLSQLANPHIDCLDRWLNSHIKKGVQASESSSTEKQNTDCNEISDEDDIDSDDVRLLVVEGFSNDDSKSSTLKWTLNKGVEIVDLSEKEEEEEEPESLEHSHAGNDKEKSIEEAGRRRVLEALQTYPWHELADNAQQEEDNEIKENEDSNEVATGGDFEELMSKLSTFKQTTDNLPRHERYAFAEKIALSFYSAMGGDSDEPESVE